MPWPITRGFGAPGIGGAITQGFGDLEVTLEPGPKGSKYVTYERGIRLANVIRGKATSIVNVDGIHIFYVNAVETYQMPTSDRLVENGQYSGAVKYRFRDYRKFNLPDSINKSEDRSTDEYGNTVYFFTGKLSP